MEFSWNLMAVFIGYYGGDEDDDDDDDDEDDEDDEDELGVCSDATRRMFHPVS